MELSLEEFIQQAKALYSTPLESIDDFDELHNLQFQDNECLFVWELDTGEIKFSIGFEGLLGHQEEVLKFERFLQLVHPEDVSMANNISQESILYLLKHPENSKESVLYLMFRMLNQEGDFVRILGRSTVFSQNSEGQLLSILIRLTDIDFTDVPDVVSYRFEAQGLDTDQFHNSVYGEHLHLFTRRELEIIQLIRQGKSNIEISDLLGISKHTIATHRKKILHKSQCHTADELILFCLRTGVLR